MIILIKEKNKNIRNNLLCPLSLYCPMGLLTVAAYHTFSDNAKVSCEEVLGRLSRLCPMLLLEQHVLLKEIVVEQLQHLPPATASHLLHAVTNSLKIDVPLRDSLIIALRKMLFSK